MQTMDGTERPTLCAERRDPPTARMRHPSLVRLKKMWAMAAMPVRMHKLTGTPERLPAPNHSQTVEGLIPAAISIEYLSSSRSTHARVMISVTSVVRNARSRRKPINTPLIKPTAAPMATTSSITKPTGHCFRLIIANVAKLASAKIEPTLRSIPPPAITNIMPSTTKPNSPS